jgi:hypothetical protein
MCTGVDIIFKISIYKNASIVSSIDRELPKIS